MEEEFDLSKKMVEYDPHQAGYFAEDVREFIRLLKYHIKHGLKGDTEKGEPKLIRNQWVIIDKLAGKELR